MTLADLLSYSSSTVLGGEIKAIQDLYASAKSTGAPDTFLTPLAAILENLIALNEQLIAYDKQVSDFQSKCSALAKAGSNGVAGVSPMAATAIGLGSAGLGGILGFAAAKAWAKPKEDEEETGE